MFTQLPDGKIVCNEGIEMGIFFEGGNDYSIAYSEQGKKLYVSAYHPLPFPDDPMMWDKIPLVVEVPQYLRWLKQEATGEVKPIEGGILSANEKDRVLNNIQRALEFSRKPFKFVQEN